MLTDDKAFMDALTLGIHHLHSDSPLKKLFTVLAEEQGIKSNDFDGIGRVAAEFFEHHWIRMSNIENNTGDVAAVDKFLKNCTPQQLAAIQAAAGGPTPKLRNRSLAGVMGGSVLAGAGAVTALFGTVDQIMTQPVRRQEVVSAAANPGGTAKAEKEQAIDAPAPADKKSPEPSAPAQIMDMNAPSPWLLTKTALSLLALVAGVAIAMKSNQGLEAVEKRDEEAVRNLPKRVSQILQEADTAIKRATALGRQMGEPSVAAGR